MKVEKCIKCKKSLIDHYEMLLFSVYVCGSLSFSIRPWLFRSYRHPSTRCTYLSLSLFMLSLLSINELN